MSRSCAGMESCGLLYGKPRRRWRLVMIRHETNAQTRASGCLIRCTMGSTSWALATSIAGGRSDIIFFRRSPVGGVRPSRHDTSGRVLVFVSIEQLGPAQQIQPGVDRHL